MSKTKLLILLLTSFFVFLVQRSIYPLIKNTLGYIGGVFSLLLKNFLKSYLKNLGI